MSFKSYDQQQLMLLPPSFDELIPQKDPVRVVNEIVERLDLSSVYAQYKKLGCASYHPKMMIKIIIYAYLRNIYSSRKIEDITANDIRFIWLSGMQRPDHNTINTFRSSKLKTTLKEVFAQIVHFMVEEKMVSLENAYTDGTKIEANANRYTFVWGRSIQTRIGKIADQINSLWEYAESVTKEELSDRTPVTHQDITSEKITGLVEKIDQALSGVEIDKKVKDKIKRIKKSWPEQVKRYEEQGAQMGERSSMSKTDPDATFMPMKEDHMGNGQLKPAYNIQISTENGIITNYTGHQTTTDTTTYQQHMQEYHRLHGTYPTNSICDAGYGSEENYLFAQQNEITPYIKYNYFHKEQTKNWKNNPFLSSNFYYNAQKDCCYCPMGQEMVKIGQKRESTRTGFLQIASLYKAKRCTNCPLRGSCHQSKGERIIQINHRLKKLKKWAKELLMSEQGLHHRSQRPADVEQTFGNLKANKLFKRFLLRGLKKVEVEFGLLSIAHNISKLAIKQAI
jgi:transposase